ncbi:MAG: FAD-dependent oxidoreductase, partial [Xanthobacteraceae bacterium]
SVNKLEIISRPPEKEDKLQTSPNWPYKLRTSTSHQEGAEREFSVLTQEFVGQHGRVKTLKCVRCDDRFKPIPGTEFDLKGDLVLLAMGFVHPVHDGMIEALHLELDQRGNVKADTESYRTSIDKVFACGDMRRGQSLVVWAFREGRQTAHSIDKFLMGSTHLPR